jgi:hypothetical protein
MRIAYRVRALAIVAAATLGTACSGGSGGAITTTPTPTPAIAFSASVSSLDLTQGGTANVAVTVTRSGGFTGDVSVTVEGLPSGVTSSPLTITSANASGTVTLTAAATATVVAANLTLRASGTGVSSATATLALNVRAAASVAVTFAPSSLSIVQGATVNVTATIVRAGGFTGPVTLTVAGAPAGLTVIITQTASTQQRASAQQTTSTQQTATVTSSSANIAFTASTALAVGTYPIAISASGTGVTTSSVNFTTTVSAPVVTTVTLTFCGNGPMDLLFFQDGTAAPWARGQKVGANYTATFTQSLGAVWRMTDYGTDAFDASAFYASVAELQAIATASCAQAPTLKSVMGSVVGVASGEHAEFEFGSAAWAATGNGIFTMSNVPPGALDLVAARYPTIFTYHDVPTTIVIRRGLNISDGAAISPVIDLSVASGEAFAPVMHTVTVNGPVLALTNVQLDYLTAAGTSANFQLRLDASSSAHTFPTVPSNRQAAGDLHLLTISTQHLSSDNDFTSWAATRAFSAPADQTVTLGPAPSAFTLSILSAGPPVRLRAAIPVQAEYGKTIDVSWAQDQVGAHRRLFMTHYTAAYFGSTTTLNADLPDLSPTGLAASWGMKPGTPVNVTTIVTGWNAAGGGAAFTTVDGAVRFWATSDRSITP